MEGTGYGGIVNVCSTNVESLGGYTRYHWPLVELSGSNADGIWSVHAGCGNDNGRDACNAICKSLGHDSIKSDWDVECGTGYGPDAARLAEIAPECTYKRDPISDDKDDWYGRYGSTETCGNPMNHCDCVEGKYFFTSRVIITYGQKNSPI